MLSSLLVCASSGLASAPTIEQLNLWASTRNTEALAAVCDVPPNVPAPWLVIKSGGAYGVGNKGWRAVPAGNYVVLTTPLTSEDIGELVFRRNGARLTYIPETNLLGMRPVNHQFDLKFELSNKKALLRDRATFVSNGTGPWLTRFSPNYQMVSITDGQGHPVRYLQAGGVVFFAQRPATAKFDYIFNYIGTVDQPQFAGTVSLKEATLVNDYWYPMIGRWPSTYSIRATVKPDWTFVAQGKLNGVKTTGGVRTYAYRMDLPVAYFSVAGGPYRHYGQTLNGRPYQIWSPRISPEQMALQPELLRPVWEFYNGQFGPMPWAGYGFLDSPGYGGGALEAYSFATWGGGLPAEDAHEPAHSWWGGRIVNTYLRSFWNESFAVWSEGLYRREGPIGHRPERRRAFVSDSRPSPAYNRESVGLGGAFAGEVASSLGYGKGAAVLQMLEQTLGTPEMTACAKTWLQTQPKGIPGEWEDFIRVVERRNPSPFVKGFLQDWIYGKGYADLEISNTAWSGGQVTFTPRFKGLKFRMPLEVMLEYPSGRQSFNIVRLDGEKPVSIPSPERPSLVSYDPFFAALRTRGVDESVTRLSSLMRGRAVRTADGKFGLVQISARSAGTEIPENPAGYVIYGDPNQHPEIADLLAKADITVSGSKLTYKGTTIDLNAGGALAVIDLPEGKTCVVGTGTIRHDPDLGDARLAVFDAYGRMLRGETEPKRSGTLTTKLN